MQIARIVGHAVSAQGHSSLRGTKLLLCQAIDGDDRESGEPYLAIDRYGAGLHDRVLVVMDGSVAQAQVGDEHSPLRNVILGIIDATTH
jgi:ethanolamine utilization protein EutN